MLGGTLTPWATVPSRGVPARRRIAALAATLAVAIAPGAALAQNGGAGDEQYEDPFQSESTPKTTTKPKPTPVQPVPHQQVETPEQQAEPQAAPAPAAQTDGGELPRTGLDLAPLAAAGIALVAAGLLLRRRAGHGRD
jgi:LPXTG-motif cell wall-anchored protein